MSNSTPSTPPAGEEPNQARAQAEAALKEHGWIPRRWDSFAGAMDAGTSDGSYSLRMYPADGPDAPRAVLCQIDDWTREGNDIIPDLWVVGIPRSEEVPELFSRYPQITGWTDVGGPPDRIVDLLTGEIIVEKEAQRLLQDPTLEMIRDAKGRLGGFEEATRALHAVGWAVREVRLLPGDGRDTIVAEPRSGR